MICRYKRIAVLVLYAGLLAGCGISERLPARSFAKFVRPADAEKQSGRLGFSPGVQLVTQNGPQGDFEGLVQVSPMEALASFLMWGRYELFFSVGPQFAPALEGNLTLLDHSGVRLGILHGIGLNCMIMPQISAGLFLQFATRKTGAGFLGMRYTYVPVTPYDGCFPADDGHEDHETHYVTGSLGYMINLGGLRIGPEIAFSFGWDKFSTYYYRSGFVDGYITVIVLRPMVTLAVDY